jgi:magnesium-transporting ATPase (P-type)
MRFNRPVAATIGLLTLVPYVWFAVFFPYYLRRLETLGEPTGITAADYFPLFNTVWLLSILVMGLTLALLVVYFIHLYRSGAVPTAHRNSWAAMLFVLGFILLPVYWYRYMWRASSAGAA